MADLPGTVRASTYLDDGVTSIYVKLGDDQWQAIYVRPDTGQAMVSAVTFRDQIATRHPIVFWPEGE